MIGIGYRSPLASWLASKPAGVDCLEITAEHFYGAGEDVLSQLRKDFHLSVHGLGLSLGTPGPLDKRRVERFARVVSQANPSWISEHVAFTRTAEVDLGHLNPVRPTRETARAIAEHARELMEYCGKPLLLENITSHIRVEGELSETEFLNEICARANCGLLLDVTNLFINSRNHGFDPLAWLRELDPSRIGQLHIVGYTQRNGHFEDGHSEPIQPELLELAQAALAHGAVEAIFLERDENFPGAAAMTTEVQKLQGLLANN